LLNEDDSTIVETAITKDGIQNFAWHNEGGETNVDAEKNKNKRKAVYGLWSENSKQLAIVKADNRKVKDLWVINSIADPRPTLETYKYWMPGEKEAPVDHLMLVDMVNYTNKEINVSFYKDQDIALWNKSAAANTRDDEFKPMIWLGTNEQLYLARTSRDLKKIDQCVVNTTTGEVKVLVAESMNTSIEIKKPELIKAGAELIEWSERDGWAHLYLYDGQGKLKNQITQTTSAYFEPALDYVIVKVPRWNFDKFKGANDTLGLQMKSVGEVMAIGRSFTEAIQKACQSLENEAIGLGYYGKSLMKNEELMEYIKVPKWDRIFRIKDALMQGSTVRSIVAATGIDSWFLYQIRIICNIEKQLMNHDINSIPTELIKEAKQHGFSDMQIAKVLKGNTTDDAVYEKRKALGITRVYKMVDTCSAEFEAKTPYFYSTFEN